MRATSAAPTPTWSLPARRAACPPCAKTSSSTRIRSTKRALIGADAVLLIVRALSDADLRDLLALADALGMAALVETHSADEVARALRRRRPHRSASTTATSTRWSPTSSLAPRLRPLVPPRVRLRRRKRHLAARADRRAASTRASTPCWSANRCSARPTPAVKLREPGRRAGAAR